MINEKLRKFRVKKKISLDKLSQITGISKSYLSYIERGIQENPSLNVLLKISHGLEVPLEDLLGESNPELFDREWLNILERAIRKGITKEEFINFFELMQHK